MKRSMIAAMGVMAVAAVCLAGAGVAWANVVTLEFDVNTVFTDYATSDDTLLNQAGTARKIWWDPNWQPYQTGRAYRTYSGSRDAGATAAQDLQSVANILSYGAEAGYQGISHVQLWFCGGGGDWGDRVVMKPNTTLTVSVNGEGGWTGYSEANPWQTGYSLPMFNTVLGGTPETQNAISPGFHQASEVWSVTGDLYLDNDDDGIYDAGDTDLVVGQQYPIWFNSVMNNWYCEDAYGNSGFSGGGPGVDGTLMATATPEPATIALLGLGSLALLRRKMKA